MLVAPVDAEEQNSTVLATWPYGLGGPSPLRPMTAPRWATQWTAWPDYDKFFSQLVRWSMRPVNDAGKFTIATDVEGNRVKVFVTALDSQDEFLNFLNLTGSVVGPDSEPREIKLEQISPGRYVGDFEANETGSYFAMLSPGPGLSPVARESTSRTRPNFASAKETSRFWNRWPSSRPPAVAQGW